MNSKPKNFCEKAEKPINAALNKKTPAALTMRLVSRNASKIIQRIKGPLPHFMKSAFRLFPINGPLFINDKAIKIKKIKRNKLRIIVMSILILVLFTSNAFAFTENEAISKGTISQPSSPTTQSVSTSSSHPSIVVECTAKKADWTGSNFTVAVSFKATGGKIKQGKTTLTLTNGSSLSPKTYATKIKLSLSDGTVIDVYGRTGSLTAFSSLTYTK